jgi:hypothetical protein
MKPSHNNLKRESFSVSARFTLPIHFAADFPIEFLIQRPVDVPLCMLRTDTRLLPTESQQPALTRHES